MHGARHISDPLSLQAGDIADAVAPAHDKGRTLVAQRGDKRHRFPA